MTDSRSLERAISIDWGKFGAAVIALVYFSSAILDPSQFRFIDHINLFVHEAGHLLFSPFGMTISIMGGTIVQVLMPLLFVRYFFFQGEVFSASLVLFWLGQNFINVSVYAADAQAMALPLVGGEIHDWNYLLTHFDVLGQSALISKVMFSIGALIIVVAAISSLALSRKNVV
ncbi:MAG: hypothetical protein Q7S52_05030 [bacterium]|nr:hypothetical protein [bacterium]